MATASFYGSEVTGSNLQISYGAFGNFNPGDLFILVSCGSSNLPNSFSGTNGAPSLSKLFELNNLPAATGSAYLAVYFGVSTSSAVNTSYVSNSAVGFDGAVTLGFIVAPSSGRIMRSPVQEATQRLTGAAPESFSLTSVSGLNSGDVLLAVSGSFVNNTGYSALEDTDGTWGTVRQRITNSRQVTGQTKTVSGGVNETFDGSTGAREARIVLVSCQEQREDPHWGILA